MELICPHCGERRTVKLPNDKSVAIAVCLKCGEVIVVYNHHAVALDRDVLAKGSIKDKREQIAAMILEFAQREQKNKSQSNSVETVCKPDEQNEIFCDELLDDKRLSEDLPPITDEEVADFRRIDLNLIDYPTYFEHVFGASD